ncbi:hypothetical protein MED217_15205 [Leeuwenhoekiella blandensis MED217]|uniref:Uncharacterized protein n=1 Tax=Leeuwenhoekiella blandensis (strain CECT 7118 / CCUG 51940 / KCTC 22103 / MED217) TaxID=398720 RepID=A3XG49_LEEBM|nr:hypothetical protein MED217_15205 [Leeuwenhoekiella blandensis MED217]
MDFFFVLSMENSIFFQVEGIF